MSQNNLLFDFKIQNAIAFEEWMDFDGTEKCFKEVVEVLRFCRNFRPGAEIST